jgi:hypothetical protein
LDLSNLLMAYFSPSQPLSLGWRLESSATEV